MRREEGRGTGAPTSPISSDVAVRAAAYGASVLGCVAALSSDPLLFADLGLFLFAAAWSLAFEPRRPHLFFAGRVRDGLIFAGSAALVIAAMLFSSASSGAASALLRPLAFVTAIVALSRDKTAIDIAALSTATLIFFVASAAGDRPRWFLPLLLGAVLLLLFAWQRTAAIGAAGARADAPSPRVGPAIRVALAELVVVLLVGATFFVFFPRSLTRDEPANDAAARAREPSEDLRTESRPRGAVRTMGGPDRSPIGLERGASGRGNAGGRGAPAPPRRPQGGGDLGTSIRESPGAFDYDPDLAGRAIGALGDTVGSAVRWTLNLVRDEQASFATIACLIATLVIAWLFLPRRHKSRIRRALAGIGGRRDGGFYHELLWLLERRGLRKPPGMTGAEFAPLASRRAPRDAISYLTDAFYRVSYGGAVLGKDERMIVRAMLAKVEATEEARAEAPGGAGS